MTPQELREFMQKWNLKQKHFAALFGIPQNSVSRFLNGEKTGRKIKQYYSKSFYYFSLLSENQQRQEIEKVKAEV